jgi:hypothetical protein
MLEVQLKLAVLWGALMLSYLLGDVLRIFSGDAVPGQIFGPRNGQAIWLGIAMIMVLPILMIGASVALDGQPLRWITVVVAVGLFLFNIIGLPTYPGLYDKFLNVVGLGFNAATAWYAWTSLA